MMMPPPDGEGHEVLGSADEGPKPSPDPSRQGNSGRTPGEGDLLPHGNR